MALVTSRLDYCNALLAVCPNNPLNSLQLFQNKVAQVLTGINKRDHVSPMLTSLHWLSVKFRIKFKILLNTYNALKGQAPCYLWDLKTLYLPNRALCFQSAGLLVVPKIPKSTFGGRAFCYQSPILWNQLKVWVKEADTASTFKTKLKRFLFSKAYS